jgi:hypothetical protein
LEQRVEGIGDGYLMFIIQVYFQLMEEKG